MTKTGRNDPCPCGSGKKYKQCCLLKQPVPGQKKKFKATVLSQPKKEEIASNEAQGEKSVDLMERTFGNAIAATLKSKAPKDTAQAEQASE